MKNQDPPREFLEPIIDNFNKGKLNQDKLNLFQDLILKIKIRLKWQNVMKNKTDKKLISFQCKFS